MNSYSPDLHGSSVLITGGAGFIGSNLAHILDLGEPAVGLREGLARTLDYYRIRGEHYWDANQ